MTTTVKATKKSSKKSWVKPDVYAEVTADIVSALESGKEMPWVKPWKSVGALRNAFTNRAYRGMNTIILGMSPYSDPRWATYKQIASNGGTVLKGEKGTRVTLWKFFKDKKDESKIIPMLRTFTVFNIEQTEGLTLPSMSELTDRAKENSPEKRDDLEAVIHATGADIEYVGDKAYYSPSDDHIKIPTLESFKSQDGFYSTVFHELGHWTGAESRLNREGIVGFGGFGSETYAFEELVAELTSAFIGRDLGIDGQMQDNHAGYIKSWIKVLKNDKKAIFRASSLAEKAAKFIMGDSVETYGEEE